MSSWSRTPDRRRRSRWCTASSGTWGPRDRALPRGAIAAAGGADTGTNSYGRTGWLPPDPPTGHGPHDYVFQLFALGEPLPLDADPGRGALVDALAGRVRAAAVLTGTWERGAARS